jgi:tetratricopeptide (TPR) repeat protein
MHQYAIQQVFNEAVALHQAGRLPEAEARYRDVLTAVPSHVGALNLLGVLALQAGHPAPALDLLNRATSLAPDHADTHCNRGRALKALGRMEEAIDSLREATRLGPAVAGLHLNLGNALREAGRLEEAVDAYRRSLALAPDYLDAQNNLGHALAGLARYVEAADSFRAAIALRPEVAPLHYNLGAALHAAGDPARAAVSFREAARLAPDEAENHHALGIALGLSEQPEIGAAAFREALRLRPDEAAWHTELGFLLMESRRMEEAEVHFMAALHLAPERPDALHDLGNCLSEAGREAEAMACYDEALRLDPDHARSRCARAVIDLVNGRMEVGWEGYEARFEAWLRVKGRFGVPPWRGEALEDGQVVLLHAEQGFGDTIQFCRYVPLVGAKAHVVLEVQEPLVRLLSTLVGDAQIIPAGAQLPRFDRHCPLLSLPLAFGTRLENVPANVPYLAADPVQVAEWQVRLADCPGLRVGVVWAGTREHIHDRRRSIPAAQFDALAGIRDVSFVSLQKGGGDDRPAIVTHDWTMSLNDFSETAALVCALDLVISVDTAVAHLAGALGRPVWLLNRFDTDWRWLRDRSDSPWYPSLRQFRQNRWGDWSGVLAAVRVALEEAARTMRF